MTLSDFDLNHFQMARLARVVIPDLPHHVTQRGNGRAQTFFGDDDYRLYLDLLRKHCTEAEVGIWAGVLMPNHVHVIFTPRVILTPRDADAIRCALSKGASRSWFETHPAGAPHREDEVRPIEVCRALPQCARALNAVGVFGFTGTRVQVPVWCFRTSPSSSPPSSGRFLAP